MLMCLQLTCDVDSKSGFSKNQKLGIPRSKRHSQARERMVLKSDHLHQIGIITNEEAFFNETFLYNQLLLHDCSIDSVSLDRSGSKNLFLSSNF